MVIHTFWSLVDSLPKGIGDRVKQKKLLDSLVSPSWTHCRKALVTRITPHQLDANSKSLVDSLPKGIGDLCNPSDLQSESQRGPSWTHCRKALVTQSRMKQLDKPSFVPRGLIAERHW